MIKLFNKVAIIDASYFLHRSLKQPDLWELRNPTTGERTGGIYGFLKIFASELKNLDYYPIAIWDAGLSDRRLKLLPNYKRTIDKTIEDVANKVALHNLPIEDVIKDYEWKLSQFMEFEGSVEEIRARVQARLKDEAFTAEEVSPDDDYLGQYRRQRAVIMDVLAAFGIPSIRINGWEGDDLMTIVSRLAKQSVVLTDDNDMKQLADDNIDIYRPMAKQWFKKCEIEEPYTVRDYVIVKAITGDGSDNIPSVTAGEERKFSLGAKRAWAVSRIIIENDEDPDKYLPILESFNKNYYKGFIKNHDAYLRNMGLVDLSLVDTDEEVVKSIEASVNSTLGKSNMFTVLSILGSHGINNVDVNGLLARVMMVSHTVKL